MDRERISTYHLTLRARDHGIPPLESIQRVDIEIDDINDNDPYFFHERFWVNVKEDDPVGHSIMQFRAGDLDEGKNAELTYSLEDRLKFSSFNCSIYLKTLIFFGDPRSEH